MTFYDLLLILAGPTEPLLVLLNPRLQLAACPVLVPVYLLEYTALNYNFTITVEAFSKEVRVPHHRRLTAAHARALSRVK